MKKSFLLLAAIFISFVSVSCNQKSTQSLIGEWAAEITLKSELAGNPEQSSEPVAFLYTKQKTNLIFAEGGVFTRKVEQTVDRVEFVKKSEDEQAAKDYFSQFYNKNLVFDGEYTQFKNTLSFQIDTVSTNGEKPVSYAESFVNDPSISQAEDDFIFSFEGENLIIDGVKYNRIK